MKNNKVLAVALSAGLVLGGAYAIDANNNVAYAAEPSATKAELEKQIADAKSQKLELDKKKAQCNNAINYRAGLRKSDDLSDEKLKEYDQLDAKDRAKIEELDKKIAVIDQTIANLKAQLDAADKKDEEPKEKPEDSSEEVEWNGYDDDYNREWKDASREQDEKLAKEKSEESSEEETEWNGYDDEYTRKWAEASREQDKKIAEAKLNEAKSAAKAIVDSNVEAKNITKEEGESYKTRIDAANSKEEINAILKEIYNKYKGEKEEFVIKGHIYRPYESESFADFTIDSKNYDNDFSKTVSAAYDYVNTAYGTKYRVEVADGGYTLNFHLLEEEVALTPLEPAKKHDTDITPNPGHVIIPSETIEDETTKPSEDKPSVDEDKEQKAKDYIEQLDKITKEIQDTLIENEKNIDDKKPSEEEKPSNEKPSEEKPSHEKTSEEKPAKENKPAVSENKVEKKVVAKKVAKHDNPKTGVVAMSSVVSTLAISMAGIVATRKKND